MTMRRCIECNVRIDTDTCDCCGRFNDPVINGQDHIDRENPAFREGYLVGYAAGLARGKFLGKPIFKPFLRQTHVGTAWTFDGAPGGQTFTRKIEAERFALENGWRLEQPEDKSPGSQVKVGDRIPAGVIGGLKWVMVITKVIDEYHHEGILELAE